LGGLVHELKRMSDAHNAGDIDQTIPAGKFHGAYRDMANGINQMVAGHIAVKKKAMACIAEFGKGNFDAPLETFPGKKALVSDTIENFRDNLKNVAGETLTLAKAAANGALDVRADEKKYAGAWRQMIQGMNKTLEGFEVPVQDIGEILTRMANKDFSQTVERSYPGAYGKLSSTVNLVVRNVGSALEQINESATQFAEGCRAIAESSQTLGSGVQAQSSSIEEIIASMEELSGWVQMVKKNAEQADQVAREANQLAEAGGLAVQKSVESIGQIRNRSPRISDLIQVISEIASQTNPLALDAAIGAARAGEHGVGLAVVANEARKLVGQSDQVARDISPLTKESTQEVEEDTHLIDTTGDALNLTSKAA
jgi:methyl-accepting chemotaxis protein